MCLRIFSVCRSRPRLKEPTISDVEIAEGTPTASPSLARSTASMSAATLLSRLTGFVRTWAMAVTLGLAATATGPVPIASSFNISNNIPNMIYELLAGGLLSSMLIPIFLEKLRNDGQDEAFRFVNTLFSIALVGLGIVALIATFFPEPFVRSQTFTVSPAQTQLAVYLFRFFAVQIVFYGFAAINTGVLNSYRKFFAPAVAPVFNNIVVIVVLLGIYGPLHVSHPQIAIIALGVGTTLGVVALLAFQLPPLFRLGFRFRWSWDFHDPQMRKMIRKMTPVLFYVVINMVQISFRNAFATQVLRDGSAALSYAWLWYQLPYGVLAVAYITAVFPEMSDLARRGDWSAYKNVFSRGVRVMGLLIMPVSAMVVALATPLVSLYRAGQFSGNAVVRVVPLVQLWAVGLVAWCAFMLTLRAFHAMQDSLTPAIVNVILTVGQIVLYWYFTRPGNLGLPGIPLADTIFSFSIWITLVVILRRRRGAFGGRAVIWSLTRVALASVAAGAAAWWVSTAIAAADVGSGLLVSFAQILAGGIVGLGIAYGACALMRVGEMREAGAMVRRVVGRFGPGAAT
jgi:putative peptidoglycan lipid II flippase